MMSSTDFVAGQADEDVLQGDLTAAGSGDDFGTFAVHVDDGLGGVGGCLLYTSRCV